MWLSKKKCFDKFDEFKKQNKTIVLVTHSINQIENLCENAVFLERGKIGSSGTTIDVVANYMRKIYNKEFSSADVQKQKGRTEQIEQKNRWGNMDAEITDVKFLGSDGEEKYVFKTGDTLVVRMKYFAKKKLSNPSFGIAIYNNNGVHINGTSTRLNKLIVESIEGYGEVEYSIKRLDLLDGTYYFSASIYDYLGVVAYDHHDRRFNFSVINETLKAIGITYIPCEWKITNTAQ